ncbi:MAG TPA: SH3 domain-containing protein, partial [Steroidobacteraceae bacterium]|nr:SH3 domain-containing protein [Steroidobacteraceae bacterium]
MTPKRTARAPAAPLLLLCALAAPAARAETLYVVEQLVVNVNSAPDASGERIATVKSGEGVEALERVRDQVHVKLAGGKDGWIRASYLSADEPLRPRLAERTAEVARLREDVSRVQAQLDAAR